MLRSVLLLVMLLALPVSGQAEDWVYTVRPGDNIWNICSRYVAIRGCWQKLGPYNQIDQPRQLPPGSIIKIPHEWLKQKPLPAVVTAVHGHVWRKGADGLRTALKSGDHIAQGESVETEDGSASVRIGDDSTVIIKANTKLTFDRLHYQTGKAYVDTELRLHSGELINRVKPQRKRSRYRIVTPAGIAAVRGTEYRTRYQSQLQTEVLRGEVVVNNELDTREVASGYGLVSEPNKPLPVPKKLLAAPKWQKVPANVALPYTLNWHKIDKATAYNLDIYTLGKNGEKNENIDRAVLVESRQLQQTESPLQLLPDNNYRLVLNAIDADGMAGVNKQIELSITTPVAPPEAKHFKTKAIGDSAVQLSWPRVRNATRYQVEYSADEKFVELLHSDEIFVSNNHIELPLALGQYVRIRALTSNNNESDFSQPLQYQQEESRNWLTIAHVVFLLAIVGL